MILSTGDPVHSELQTWLDELLADGLHLSGEPAAGAMENLWCISLPTELGLGESDLVEFLWRAMAIRRTLADSHPVRTATFYAWHDDIAGQLRFSTAHCTSNTLPFGAATLLVEHPDEIVREFLDSPYLDGIPSSELKSVPFDEPDEPATDISPIRVWAVELA